MFAGETTRNKLVCKSLHGCPKLHETSRRETWSHEILIPAEFPPYAPSTPYFMLSKQSAHPSCKSFDWLSGGITDILLREMVCPVLCHIVRDIWSSREYNHMWFGPFASPYLISFSCQSRNVLLREIQSRIGDEVVSISGHLYCMSMDTSSMTLYGTHLSMGTYWFPGVWPVAADYQMMGHSRMEGIFHGLSWSWTISRTFCWFECCWLCYAHSRVV